MYRNKCAQYHNEKYALNILFCIELKENIKQNITQPSAVNIFTGQKKINFHSMHGGTKKNKQ